MTDFSARDLLMIALLILAGMIVAYQVKARTGKSMFDSLAGPLGRQKGAPAAKPAPARPVEKNCTKSDLTAFLSRLLRFSRKSGMHLVAPGSITYNGQTARLTAFFVSPREVLGIYSLGFGGTVTPAKLPDPWKQHMNGSDRTFENPVKICREQHDLVAAALEDAGIHADVRIVAVFTNPRVTLQTAPAGVYTLERFFTYLDECAKAPAPDCPAIDPVAVSQTLAQLAGIKTRKAK